MTDSVEVYTDLNFPSTLEDATKRSNEFRFEDPFSDIKPALLNRTDIAKYVSKTGMIFPFNPDKLKPASYEIALGDEVLYWDENGEKTHLTELSSKNKVPIRRNSITYVSVAAKFQLPYYIALRFNLSITHVHRGLLLGTGPLIDPGFNGKLMIPIHNLTTNDYTISPGDDLIAVEFTKLSEDIKLDDEKMQDAYRKNVKKPDLSFDDYINSAIKPLKSVESSLEQTFREHKTAVDSAKKQAEQVRAESQKTSKIITGVGIITAAALVIGTIAAFVQIKSLITDANKYVSDAAMVIKDENGKLYDFRESIKINKISKQFEEQGILIESLNDNFVIFSNDMDAIRKKIAELEDNQNTLLNKFKQLSNQNFIDKTDNSIPE